MIDFTNPEYLKLRPVSDKSYESLITPMLIDGEKIVGSFQSVRDGIVFTNKRIIAISIQGVTGKKKDITSLPYRKIQAYSIETAGVFDFDSELELWFSSMGKIRFEFISTANVADICRIISTYVL